MFPVLALAFGVPLFIKHVGGWEYDRITDDGLPIVYDAGAIETFWQSHPLVITRRAGEIVVELAPLLVKLSFGLWTGSLRGPENAEYQRKLAIILRETLTRLGPAFVKLGQALSIRPDVLPEPALLELRQLCDSCPPFSVRACGYDAHPDEFVIASIQMLVSCLLSHEMRCRLSRLWTSYTRSLATLSLVIST